MVYLSYSKPNARGRDEMSAEGRRLLRFLLERAGESPELPMSRDANGRPYIIGRKDLDFNISHSERLAVCALSFDGRVGVDTEPKISSVPPERQDMFAKKYFSEKEKTAFLADPACFSRIWTAKEAYLKREGVGIATKLSEADTESLPEDLKLVFLDTEDHYVTICIGNDVELKIIENE